MKNFLSAVLLCLTICIANQTFSQICGNCNNKPFVAQFDIDLKQTLAGSNEGQIEIPVQYRQLANLGKYTNELIQKNNKNCIWFTQPPVPQDSTQVSEVSRLHLLPPGQLTFTGDYISTGHIRKEGSGFVLQMELQAKCSRKIVAAAEVHFQLPQDSVQTMSIAERLDSEFSPLIDKIRDFEIKQRNADNSLSLFQNSWDQPIKITAQRTNLKAGESTDITIELRDCDGAPLVGREIAFNDPRIEGFKIKGTMGGTVSPSKLVTDAKGMAKAKYTLKAGAKEAIIVAHSPGLDVKGCRGILIGEETINIQRTYSGFVKYSFGFSANCASEQVNGCLLSKYKGNTSHGVNYVASFTDDSPKGNSGVMFSGEEDEDPLEVPKLMEGGNYNMRKLEIREGIIVCESVGKGDTYIQRIQTISEGGLQHGNFIFDFGSDGGGRVQLTMVFNTRVNGSFEQTLLPSGKSSVLERTSWDFSAIEGQDKDFTFKKQSIGGGKVKYTVSGTRNFNPGCGHNSTETINVSVIEE